MEEQLNETKRMQQLAGLLNEDSIELSDPELAVRWLSLIHI